MRPATLELKNILENTDNPTISDSGSPEKITNEPYRSRRLKKTNSRILGWNGSKEKGRLQGQEQGQWQGKAKAELGIYLTAVRRARYRLNAYRILLDTILHVYAKVVAETRP